MHNKEEKSRDIRKFFLKKFIFLDKEYICCLIFMLKTIIFNFLGSKAST